MMYVSLYIDCIKQYWCHEWLARTGFKEFFIF